ncbi:MAG: DUF1549 domain-containing protein [Acidobacteriota bacterium]
MNKACLLPVLFAASLAAQPVSYRREIAPVLQQRCVACHQSGNPSGGFVAETATGVARSARSGLLLDTLTGERPRMPKAGPPLTAQQVALLRRWVEQGAPDDSTGEPATWWSLRPLPPSRPASIDEFVHAKLQAAGLTPSPDADRRTLIRRLTYDLHGLPPTPEESDAFAADPDPRAYERLVDRLLASPRYGERWARHWLDVVHYGDSHGYDKDKPRPHSWPYRDAVIRAFNEDLSYPRFVRAQLAGDLLYPNDPHAFALTGFLAAGPWDFVGHQELKEGTANKNLTRLLDRDDMVATSISTFVSLTAHCARCHDHKFDPIPQADYYNLQAVFAGIDRADRPYDADPAVSAARRALLNEKLAVQRRLQPHLDRVEFASSPELTALDIRIQDAGLLIAHLGTPKTPAETAEKLRLETRRTADRATRQKLVDTLAGAETLAAIAAGQKELAALDARLAALPAPQLVYSGAAYFPRAGAFRPSLTPRPVHILDRGNLSAPGAPATPGALRCVPGLGATFADPGADEGPRRAALAAWITADANVLTWRSIVNRVWHYHFGAGLVDTPNDFGRMGSLPSHPELLDWLAVWFRDEAKGSLKQLHRLLVLSATYRQSSAHRDAPARLDAGNRLLWRMNRTRLDAESIRDSVLLAAGKLDLTMGGPAVRQFGFKDDHSPVYDYAAFDPDAPGGYRRSIYRFLVRSAPDPFMERLDCPDPSLLTPKRSTTLTAIQALAMWNNRFMVRMAEHLAARVAGDGDRLGRLVLGRRLATAEASYGARHGLANLARVLLNTNEFLFVD